MNRKKNRIKPELEYAKDSFLNNPVASATECTGYVQNIPDDEYEAESYGALYDVISVIIFYRFVQGFCCLLHGLLE